MRLSLMYSVKIKHHNRIFLDTVTLYREAVSFFVDVCLQEWESIGTLHGQKKQVNRLEALTVKTKGNPDPAYDFSTSFYKFPSYLRRSAIAEALGKVSSYRSLHANWEATDPDTRGKEPGLPAAGFVYPALYRDNMFVRTGTYTAAIKVFIQNTWDWIEVDLTKSDVDYILRHCSSFKYRSKILSYSFKISFFSSKSVSRSTICSAMDKVFFAIACPPKYTKNSCILRTGKRRRMQLRKLVVMGFVFYTYY